ncbi:sensor histidine kinase [Flagellimonas flava]|uniref:histidine kinase n=1 Tax=Flagellimonas flava TaxID=570519 RepID=A0A1M5KWN0_9FLAO|nr:HAMP domain-containing sensor histidine kinase [Allomuricauda flava]SHG57224.1 PAS domain S-box-containing protein [Allomuricauda flava]
MKPAAQIYGGIANLPLPVALINQKLELEECSNTLLELFNLDSARNKPVNLGELVGASSYDLAKLHKRLLDGNISKEYISHVCPKGALKWFKLIAYPIQDGQHYYLHFEDVTQKKLSLDLALQAERIARIGSWEVDLINNSVTWSAMTREIHEVPEHFVPNLDTGLNFYKEGEHRDRIVGVVSEAIEKGSPYDVELIIVTAKGNEKWVRAIGNAEIINGKASRLFGVFQDIDKRKRESLKYQALTDRMRVAVESSNIGIWDYDIVNNGLVWDDNMYKLYQVKKEDFTGVVEAWEGTIHPDDKERSLKAVEDAITGKSKFNTEFRIITSHGTIRHIHGQGKVFRDEQGNPIRMIGANTDVSRIKKVDNRLRQLLNTTEKQNKSLLNFAHIVSHNLRSNSSNLSMLTGMLLEKKDPSKQQRFLEMIRISSERLDETVVQLNEVIKIQTDPDQKFQWVGVKETLSSVLESVNALIAETKPDIQVKIDENLRIYAIKPYVASVFLNLLTNSIKYRKQGQQLKLKINALDAGDHIVISFTDNGKGIDLEKHGAKLFGMYKTFHGNKDARGIGLFISKNQMDAMNAKITVESMEGKGATFQLYFPPHKLNTTHE